MASHDQRHAPAAFRRRAGHADARFADVLEGLRDLRLGADAFYLDGFAPDRNPEMWSPSAMKALARLARHGSTVATYTASRRVRDALADAGFSVGKSAGFGRKRDMLAGRFAPRWAPRHQPAPRVEWPEHSALVVGAGLAGSAIAERLASRGWRVSILDRDGVAAGGASGLARRCSRICRATIASCRASHAAGFYIRIRDGLRCASTVPPCRVRRAGCSSLPTMRRTRRGWPMISRGSAIRGVRGARFRRRRELSRGPQSRNRRLVDSDGRLGTAGCLGARATCRGRPRVDGPGTIPSRRRDASSTRRALVRDRRRRNRDRQRCGGRARQRVRRRAAGKSRIDRDAAARARPAHSVSRIRGRPRTVVCGRGYVLPTIDGNIVMGATFDPDDGSTQADPACDVANLGRAERLLPGISSGVDPTSLRGEVGIRCVAPDRMPLAGAVVDHAHARAIADTLRGAHTGDMPRVPGLFCLTALASRGLAWAALAGECVASQIEGEPPPLEQTLVDAIDPARFAVQRARRGTL